MKKTITTLLSAITLMSASATQHAAAQNIGVTIDAGLAEFLLSKVCSGETIDEDEVRAMHVVQSQVKHHDNLTGNRDMDALIDGLKSAAQCETPENDAYLFGPVVEETQKFRDAVAFFKSRAPEIEAYVAESLAAYAPADLEYQGELVLSIVGNNCGGFSMDGRFYLALNCLRDSYEQEFSAAKIISAHETYHAVQYAFFYPFEEDIARVKTRDDAFDYLFMNLLIEGTAEYAADSREVEGEGLLTNLLKRFARSGYRQAAYLTRVFGYTADMLNAGDDIRARIEDVYNLGFGGGNGQVFYYAGAVMAGHVEEAFGRDALICIMGQPPEQFVRAYQAAALRASDEAVPVLAPSMVKAAKRLSDKRERNLRYERCVQ
ncbi:hypothetical protein PUV54_14270 [Hyphococcus flavus]|uniref:DUF2268 domain-containing protein n=1 Tax=Hyphococcus flavus TaxID=1866326 RepID=A0AAE9ZDT4_9PROT|nr:DUF5700 domain-containing putative Zn-dependent protease [Hyphococcus flavus]WDI31117.1 hypothetical protein PUV54_14270 [Hyphococcus flavus]